MKFHAAKVEAQKYFLYGSAFPENFLELLRRERLKGGGRIFQSVSGWRLFSVWLGIGMQSFGGGAVTLALIRRTVVEQQAWFSDAEFAQMWGLCQLAPGINLLGIAMLIGWRLARTKGVVCSLFGFLLSSVSLTILLTALYVHYSKLPVLRAALRGIIPATVGLGLLTAWDIAKPPLKRALEEGRWSLGVNYSLLLGSVCGMALAKWPVVAILLGAGIVGAFTPSLAVGKRRS